MVLPADSHVHSQWSWDARDGDMERTCRRAIQLGLPAVAFTEHVDFTAWRVIDTGAPVDEFLQSLTASDDMLTPPAFDHEGYLECLQRCRDMFPDLRVISGVELGEPHMYRDPVGRLLRSGAFDRVLGSLHCLPLGDEHSEMPNLYRQWEAATVIREYLTEIPRLIAECDDFSVLAHIDYPVRTWPEHAGPFDPRDFEEEYRHALRALADSGRALEVNTRIPLHPQIVDWWCDEGGEAVTFGSDAHSPPELANGFAEATALAESRGFRPGRHPYDLWTRPPRRSC